jgi:hypothetical protein
MFGIACNSSADEYKCSTKITSEEAQSAVPRYIEHSASSSSFSSTQGGSSA